MSMCLCHCVEGDLVTAPGCAGRWQLVAPPGVGLVCHCRRFVSVWWSMVRQMQNLSDACFARCCNRCQVVGGHARARTVGVARAGVCLHAAGASAAGPVTGRVCCTPQPLHCLLLAATASVAAARLRRCRKRCGAAPKKHNQGHTPARPRTAALGVLAADKAAQAQSRGAVTGPS
jgi:hypothetical protein